MQRLTALRRRVPARILIGALILAGIATAAAALLLPRDAAAPQRSYTLVAPRSEPLTATVSAAGQIEPGQTLSLALAATGRVAEVLVDVGARVSAGQALARLDDRELQLRVAQAAAALAQARISYERVEAGAAAGDIAAARAQLEQARGQLLQVQGGVTDSDMEAARAQLQQAQAALALLTGGPRQSDLDAAQARIRDAELALRSQRDQLSAAKSSARLALEQATGTLTQAQARYAQAKYNWEYVQSTGNDPVTPQVAGPRGPVPNKVSAGQRESYYAQFVQAEAALRNAEAGVVSAQVAYDNARAAEATGVERAEGQLAVAQAQLAQLGAGPESDQLAAARAQLAASRANLSRLGGDPRAGALQAAQAAVALAEARLEQIAGGPQPIELRAAQAQIDSAQAQYDLARLALDQATLRSPIDGEIAEVNLKVGESPSPALPAVVVTDLSSMRVTVTVDEIDIARVAAGQPATLTLDALGNLALAGRVSAIAPLAITQSAVTSYRVRIDLENSDPRVRPGMTASAEIVVDRRDAALVLPRRAVRNERGQLLVDLASDARLCAAAPADLPERPALEPRAVTVGLSNDQSIEILSGLTPQDCVYIESVEVRLRPLSGPPTGPRR